MHLRTVVLCMGNELNMDDGAGHFAYELLKDKASDGLTVYDVGLSPENFISVIKREEPDLLIIVDGADMGLEGGEVRIIPPEMISQEQFSTHTLPLDQMMGRVKDYCGRTVLVGIQPAVKGFGIGLSEPVRAAVERIVKIILNGRIDDIEIL